MTTTIGKVVADFETQLSTVLAVGGTSATLQSVLDDDGNPLTTGTYFLTLDRKNSTKEYIVCTLTVTGSVGAYVGTLTAINSVSRQGVVGSSGATQKHRVGASVTLTDFADLQVLADIARGATSLLATSPLFYNTNFTPTLGQYQIPTWDFVKAYADALTVSGAPYATTTSVGVGRASYSPDVTLAGNPTITIASPGVVTLASHGLTLGDTVKFTTTGTLPANITAGVSYYVISAGLTSSTFELANTPGGAAINTSGSQSGTHTAIKTTPVFMSNTDPLIPTAAVMAALAGGGAFGTPSGANKFITQTYLAAIGALALGGTGADGALNVTSGTTTLNAGQVYNYTTINVSAGATLAFVGSGPAMLNATGAVTIAGTIELRKLALTRFTAQTTRNVGRSGTPITVSPPSGLGQGSTGGVGGGASGGTGGNDGTTSPSASAGGSAGSTGTSPTAGGNGQNGNGTTLGGGGGGGGGAVFSGGGAGTNGIAGGTATNKNGGDGGGGGSASVNAVASGCGGGGGAGVDTGNGGAGGNSGSGCPTDGCGGNGGNSGSNGGSGGVGGSLSNVGSSSPGTAGAGGNGYVDGGAAGTPNPSNSVGSNANNGGNALTGNGGAGSSARGYGRNGGNGGNSRFGTGGAGGDGGSGGSGGTAGGNGGTGGNGCIAGGNGGAGGNATSNSNGGAGGFGGYATSGPIPLFLYCATTVNFSGTINAQGGTGGNGGNGGAGNGTGSGGNGGNGGDGGDSADVFILAAGVVTNSGTLNNTGGTGGTGGTAGTNGTGTGNNAGGPALKGLPGKTGRDGYALIAQLISTM